MSSLIRLVRVTDEIYVATSRRYVTNSTVILDGYGGALVIDPSWDADELAAIPEDLRTLGVRCVAGLSTHMHYDHVLWHPDLGDVPRWASAGTVEAITSRRQELLEPLVGDIPEDLIALAGHLVPISGPVLDWRGPRAVIHEHHAHALHHIAVEIPDLGLLIAGDMLSDVELPMPDSADQTLTTYRGGLLSLAAVVSRVDRVIPGHGSVGRDVRERYEQDLAYLDDVDLTGRSADVRIPMDGNVELHAENLARSAFAGARDSS
jgi:glyoxylase-like metal-dependent hydrolase (beta-lactamase superfamily II)